MTTLVGMQDKVADAVQNLIELDYDAIEAYQVAIDNVKNPDYKAKLQEFCDDHKNHIQKLSNILVNHGISPTQDPSAKRLLTKGKVVIAEIIGDNAILEAMRSNEEDTNSAYQNMDNRDDLWDDLKDVINDGLDDEKRHKAWLETIIAM